MLLRNALRGFQNLSAKVLLFFDIYKKKGWFCHYRANLYCLLANAISVAKLVKMFEEAKFRCVKVQFFSGSVV